MFDFNKEQKVIRKLKEFTQHQHINLTNRGNSAIFAAIYIAKKVNPKPLILIPDQGGWISFKTYPKLLNFEVKAVPTDYGIINLDELSLQAKNASALLITSFAGYFAEQPLKEISEVCKKNSCLLIEDATGSIGDSVLCNGNYSDIIVGSFDKYKPVDLGYGGFISLNNESWFDQGKTAMSLTKAHSRIYKELLPLLNRRNLNNALERAEKVKEELKDFDIIHRNKRGINVVAKYNNDVIKYCEKKKYKYLLCPKYIRVNTNAISIELKNV